MPAEILTCFEVLKRKWFHVLCHQWLVMHVKLQQIWMFLAYGWLFIPLSIWDSERVKLDQVGHWFWSPAYKILWFLISNLPYMHSGSGNHSLFKNIRNCHSGYIWKHPRETRCISWTHWSTSSFRIFLAPQGDIKYIKPTSILSQLQQRGVPSCSCEGQYFCSQKGCALYSIRPKGFVGICKRKVNSNKRLNKNLSISKEQKKNCTLHVK